MITICWVLAVPSLGSATTVVTNANITLTGGLGNYGLSVFQDAAATDHTFAQFMYDGANLTIVATTIDEGSDWYLAFAGDHFSAEAIATGSFTKITGPTNVGSGNFFLAIDKLMPADVQLDLTDRLVF